MSRYLDGRCGTVGCTMPYAHRGICNVPQPNTGSAAFYPCFRRPYCQLDAGHNGPCPRPATARPLNADAPTSGPLMLCVTGAPYCGRPEGHRGACRMDPDVRHARKQGAYGPGEFTPWQSKPGARKLTIGALAGAVFSSPLGALYGLALLFLLWLSGCA